MFSTAIFSAECFGGLQAAEGAVATDEGSLLAAARAEGKVLVAPGAEIVLTKTLRLDEKPNDYQRKNNHCEPPPLCDPRAAVWAGAEGRVRAVGAQAWSAPR